MKVQSSHLSLKLEDYNDPMEVIPCFKDTHLAFDDWVSNYDEVSNRLQDTSELQELKNRIRKNIDDVFKMK